MNSGDEKIIPAGAPNAPAEAKISQTIVQIGAAAVEKGVLTPAEFALALGLSLNIFAQMVAEHAGTEPGMVLDSLRESFDRGLAIKISRATETADESDASNHPPPSTEPPNAHNNNSYGIDLASAEPASGMIH